MKRKKFKLPPFNTIGFGIVYVMIYFPAIWFVKIGYTGTRSGISKRAKSVSRSAPGIAIPVGFMVLPFAWHIEQFFHNLFGGLRSSFYKGDGHTETFFFPAHIMIVIVWAVMWLELRIIFDYLSGS